MIIKLPKVWGAFLGNFFEHYDTALFTALAPFIAHLFFPNESPLASLIYTYALIPIGMTARPLGALLFGRIGDRYSRETALFYSMAGMAFVSLCLALCPTYESAGIWGAIILGACRFLQNLFASGESMGGAIYILEKAPQERHDLLSSLFSMTTVAGILCASLGVTLLYHFAEVVQNWRILYLIGCATALCGLVLRKNRDPGKWQGRGVFQQQLFSTLWNHRRIITIIALASGFSYSTYTIGLVLMNGYIPLITPFTKGEMIQLNAFLLGYMIIILPLFGKLASKISREVLMLSTLTLVVMAAPFLFQSITNGTFTQIVIVRIIFVTLGVAFSSTFHAWAQQLVPKENRYLIISIGYALGTQLFGGPCSALSLGLYHMFETSWVTSLYWVALASVNLLCIYSTTFLTQRRQSSQRRKENTSTLSYR